MRSLLTLVLSVLLCLATVGCGGGGGGGGTVAADDSSPITGAQNSYILLAWNDLGMHCLNPSYDKAVILPPYNTIHAQLIERGNPPKVVTSGVTVSYKLINNTSSYGKLNYGQFWDNCLKLFGLTLVKNLGLNLVDPALHNGLSGNMVAKADHFEVDGIPVTPVEDSGVWNPYQIAEITASNDKGEKLLSTRCTVPTSDEINCGKCHGAADPFGDILAKHDEEHGTALVANKPVLCASCHGSPALGSPNAGTAGIYLSGAIHSSHADRDASCYDCHPGNTTQCSRSLRHKGADADGNCTTCHRTMAQVGGTAKAATRVPWKDEPKCATCHSGVNGVDTAAVLYRDATGHGGLSCPACHGSPHAMTPSTRASDDYQVTQYQGRAVSMGSCKACHENSRGEGSGGEFSEKHMGTSPKEKIACNVCHTAFSNVPANWPHAYTWKDR